MAKKLSELRAKMTPEAHALARQRIHLVLLADASRGNRADFDRFLKAFPKGKPIAGDENGD